MSLKTPLTSAGAIALALAAPSAYAQAAPQTSGFSIDRFEPSERGSEWFVLDTLDLRGHARPAIGVVADYALKPLVFYDAQGNETNALVKHQLFVHPGASVVFWDRLRVGANLPIALVVDGTRGNTGGSSLSVSDGAQLGDLRLSADVRLLGEYRSVFTLAAGVSLWIPTGSQSAYTGDGTVRFAPHVNAAGEIGLFAYAAKLGFSYRPHDGSFAGGTIGSEFTWAISAGLRLVDGRLLVGPELYGTTVAEDGLFAKRGSPVEGVLGAHLLLGDAFRVGLGAGPGLNQGFGSPQFRGLASLEWVPQVKKETDRDGDGILDSVDACPDEKGVPSDDPAKNGCPPPKDTDGDGILDAVDACPTVKGVPSDDPAKNGCPKSDRDGDGILDEVDACPDEKGVPSDDPKKNGCPAPKDTDGDTIVDNEDACPTAPGPRNADPKKNGCPEARIESGQIRIVEQVKFQTNSDVILHVSDHILAAVVKIMSEHPEITKISVEGHTDNVGKAPYNKKLSERRAASVVRWLIAHGIDKGRLDSAGFGLERPIATNDTDEGRQENRRVEFQIRGGVPANVQQK